MKNLLIASAAVLAISFVSANTAEAGHRHRHRDRDRGVNVAFGGNGWHVSFGNPGRHYGRHGYYGRRRVLPRYGYRPGCRVPVYHQTGHWDYHPPQVVPHGNHLDVIPGHYDYHDTGYWGFHGRRGRH